MIDFFCPACGAISALYAQKVGIPLCRSCARRWQLIRFLSPVVTVATIPLVMVAAILGGVAVFHDDGFLPGFLAGVVLWIAGFLPVRYLWIPRRVVLFKGDHPGGVLLAVPHPDRLKAAWGDPGSP